MICPHCSNDNPEDARFCQNCGQPLEQTCPNCGTLNDLDAKFCKQCGHHLSKQVLSSLTATYQREEHITSERRVVTILFVDIKGTTALAEQLDPEEWAEIMNGAFQYLITCVTRYDGTVARLMGDAILAFFGAPVAHEDDPQRAVLAALDMLRDLRPYQRNLRERLESNGVQLESGDFELRVGINTGLVVVGEVGTAHGQEYTAMGDAINLAARMEQTAQPGTIQIAHDTYRLMVPFVEVEPLGGIEIKGKREPVQAYRVLGIKSQPSRLRKGGEERTPLVGRSEELGALKRIISDLTSGVGGIISVVGEAGMGKTRLVRALIDESQDLRGEIQWFETRSFSHESSKPYGLFLRLVSQLSGVTPDDAPEAIRKKLGVVLSGLPADHQKQATRSFERLFGLVAEGEVPLEGKVFRKELFQALTSMWRAYNETAPTVMVLRDLQWADPASVAIIGYLFQLTRMGPLIMLCLHRTEIGDALHELMSTAKVEYGERFFEIYLEPLTEKESKELVKNLVGSGEIPPAIIDQLVKKAAGNPLYLVEMVRELLASRETGESSFSEVVLPDTLQALLMARLDHLDENERRTLQMASILGRTFFVRVLKKIVETPKDLQSHLDTLEQGDLIYENPSGPEPEYTFRNDLIREAVYRTILRRKRRIYHKRTGEVMEKLFADRLDEYAPLLAHHFLEAQNYQRTLEYTIRAAEHAERLFAGTEAVLHYTKALEIVKEAGIGSSHQIRLLRRRGLVQETLGEFNLALRDFEASLNLAKSLPDGLSTWYALTDLGKLWASRDYQKTGDYFRQALLIAREMDDPLCEAHSLNLVGNWYVNAERPVQGTDHHQKALRIFYELENQPGIAATLDLLGMANVLGGDWQSSKKYYDGAIPLFRKLGDNPGLVSSLTTQGYIGSGFDTRILVPARSKVESLPLLEEALEISRKISWRAGESYALWVLGLCLGSQGQFGRALEAAQSALDVAIAIGHRQWMAGAHAALGSLFLDLLTFERSKDHFEAALDLAEEVRSQNWIHTVTGYLGVTYLRLDEPQKTDLLLGKLLNAQSPSQTVGQRVCWWARAELALYQGELESALQIINRLIETAVNLSPDKAIPLLWQMKGEALSGLGQFEEAVILFLGGIEEALVWGDRNILWGMHARLGAVYLGSGLLKQAERQFNIARAQIAEMAEKIPEGDLRDNFIRRALRRVNQMKRRNV